MSDLRNTDDRAPREPHREERWGLPTAEPEPRAQQEPPLPQGHPPMVAPESPMGPSAHGQASPHQDLPPLQDRPIRSGASPRIPRRSSRPISGEELRRFGRDARGAAAQAAKSVRGSDLWKRSRAAVGSASTAAVAGSRVAARATVQASSTAVEQGRVVYERSSRLPRDEYGDSRRPWEVKAAAILGLIAPIFIAAAVLIMAVSGGRTLRGVEWTMRKLENTTGVEPIGTVGDIASGLADAVVAVGVVAGLLVIAAFCIYAWRVFAGRGHARWVALIAVVASLFVLTPLSPTLTGFFQLFAAASLIFAFLPRSSAWAHRRRGLRRHRRFSLR